MNNAQQIVAQYNIPRYIIGTSGRQRRAATGEMFISPGVTEPLEFQYNNVDGVPLNLSGMILRLVFWYPHSQYESLSFNIENNIVLAKDIKIDLSVEGLATVLLTENDTIILGRSGKSTLRWSVYIINQEGQVFPAQLTTDGRRYGILHIDTSDLPSTEIITHLSLSYAQESQISSTIVLGGVASIAAVGHFTPMVS